MPQVAAGQRLGTRSRPRPAETIQRLEGLHELLALQSGENVLKVGCGTAQLTGWLADRVRPGRVVAIDFSPRMLQQARSRGIAAEFRLADVCQDDLGAAEFDVALCFHSFPHFRNQPAALQNLARCLKPHGRLIVMHLRNRDEVNAFHRSVGGAVATDCLPSDNDWETWLAVAGLQIEKIPDGQGVFVFHAVVCRDE